MCNAKAGLSNFKYLGPNVGCSHIRYFQSLGLICLKLTAYVDTCAVVFIAHTYMYILLYTDLTLNSESLFSENEKRATAVPKEIT